VPKEFFQCGRIVFLPHNVYGNMPLGPQMLSLLAMVLCGDWWTGALAGKTVTALFVPLTGLALFAAGRRLFCRSAGVAAALVYVSTPWLLRVSNLGLVEGVYAFYLFLSVYALILWRHPGGRGDRGSRTGAVAPVAVQVEQTPAARGFPGKSPMLLLAGFMAGGAASCKYPAVVFVVVPLAAYIFLARRRPDWRSVGIYLLATLLGCGPWFVKNLVLTGNPVYPLAYAVFGGETWTAEKDQKWRAAHDPEDFSPGDAARRWVGVLFRSEWLSPLIMPLAALSLLAGRQRRLVMWLWIYFGYVIASWWLLTHRIDRFWIPSLPVVALLAGLGATWTAAALWRRVLVPTLLLALAVSFLFAIGGPGGYNRYFVSYERLRTSAERVDPWHRFLNEHVPPGHTVLVVGDAQVFDLATPVIYSTVFDDCAFERILKGRSAAELHAWLVDNRISHVYVHWGEIARYRAPGNYGFTDFVQPSVFHMLVQRGVLALREPPIEGHPGQVYVVLELPASSTAPCTTTSSPRAGGTISYESASGGKT
jgi:hypothetical protein